MRKLLIVAAVLALGTSTAACGGMTGRVIAKEYRPGYYTPETRNVYVQHCENFTRYRTVSSGSGKTRTTRSQPYTSYECKQVWAGTEQYQQWHSSCSRVTVQTDDGKARSRCVSDAKYDGVQIGQKVSDY